MVKKAIEFTSKRCNVQLLQISAGFIINDKPTSTFNFRKEKKGKKSFDTSMASSAEDAHVKTPINKKLISCR